MSGHLLTSSFTEASRLNWRSQAGCCHRLMVIFQGIPGIPSWTLSALGSSSMFMTLCCACILATLKCLSTIQASCLSVSTTVSMKKSLSFLGEILQSSFDVKREKYLHTKQSFLLACRLVNHLISSSGWLVEDWVTGEKNTPKMKKKINSLVVF